MFISFDAFAAISNIITMYIEYYLSKNIYKVMIIESFPNQLSLLLQLSHFYKILEKLEVETIQFDKVNS